MPDVLLAWILTYALHSTVLLGAAWWLTSGRSKASERTRELVWRSALVGGLVTATLQLAGGIEPFGGRFAILDEASRGSAHESAPPVFEPTTLVVLRGEESFSVEPTEGARGRDAAGPRPTRRTPRAVAWTRWALWVLAAGGALIAGVAAGASLRLRRHLAGRERLTSGPLVARVDELRARAGVRRAVRISASARLRAPIAIGTLRPEICVPRRSVELSGELQAAMLAHELAHLVRFDPLWLTLSRTIETLLFFQPLNRLARRRLQASAEYLCDAWAVRQTHDRIGLARCLVEVAGWVSGERRALVACGMADLRSPLAARIRRILARDAADDRSRWTRPAIAALLTGTVVLVPGFARRPVEPPLAPRILRSAPLARVPAAPPAPATVARTPAALLDDLERALADLEGELAALRTDAQRRVLTPELSERLAAAEQRLGSVRERHDQLRTLLAGLVARPAVPRDVPDDIEE